MPRTPEAQPVVAFSLPSTLQASALVPLVAGSPPHDMRVPLYLKFGSLLR